ncbi:zinc finger protein 488 [Salminus brasiliensis]|uniref:zinc finger protein 488 n=1 Tax=Salminus brasiliensis TaxID=930266 RepID=UPI003B82C69B
MITSPSSSLTHQTYQMEHQPLELVHGCCGTSCQMAGTEDQGSSWVLIADMLGSIHTSCDVPAGAVFGPCDPPRTSLSDSIGLIALKCSDRRARAYAHQVDTSLASLSTMEAPAWLRLVQSARNAEEQNLEAYVKDGHLFYRALKNISKMSELLVWYGEELAELLSITCAQKSNKGYRCCYCKQSFLFEFPVLAHQRFLCPERPTRFSNSKSGPSELQHRPSTDFHNLARNLESCTNASQDSTAKRRHSLDSESDESDEENPLSGGHPHPPLKRVCATLVKRKPSSSSSSQSGGGKTSITNEGGRSLPWATHCHDNLEVLDSKLIENSLAPLFVSRARRSQLATTGPDQKEKSAFVQPPGAIAQITNLAMTVRFSHGITPTTFPSIPTHPAAAAQATKPQASALFSRGLLRQPSLVCEPGLWSKKPKPLQAQIRPEWSLLPSALSPLGLPAQNWCAKCSVSFHMTSDLVQHMRSHHKRSSEQPRQYSKERLRCPVCEEGFRERHHLSRHMSSHL